ncbi:hypothetical protein HYH02_007660 [Chlamydomonas schloesseri]|uniref:MSP domain-containing protein n=1 Tax=Chlamydomonas schloesseri TaxID=2026947 RepID=A0A835WHL9_9CHLO|nr:hypothetical protein HYH02_007660 [Chlamydomonas schloesseri]|eukprot:KAG2447331.1 hypothetical protein HYH02_007660 [Chlamydomonas schloesseri]
MAATTFVQLDPEELVFRDVKLSQVYTQTLRVTNTLRGPVELTIKPGSSERYTVVPSTIRLRAEETAAVEVRLRVLRFAQRQKAVEQGQRDAFHIKGSHFDQRFYCTFYMVPEGAEQPAGARTRPAGGTSATARSPPASPTRQRRGVTKSVSFSDPSSPRRVDSGRFASGPGSSADPGTSSRGGWGTSGSAEAGGGSQSPPQHVRGGLRQALSGLRSPQKGSAFTAMELGAQDVQRDALDRAHSLPPSPGREGRTAPLPRPVLPYTGSQQQQSATSDSGRQQSLQRGRSQQVAVGREKSPQRAALQPLPPFRSLEEARTSRDNGSPCRSVQGSRYGGASNSPQHGSANRPVEVPDMLGGVGTGPGGMSRAEWQQRRQEQQQRAQQRAAQEEEQARQLIEEETRALGLHLVRDSLDSLGMEADRLRDQSLSPSPVPPWRRGDMRGDTATTNSASDGELEDTVASGDAERAAGRGRGRAPMRSRSRSRSPEAMLLPPRDRLAELVARRAGIRTASGGSGQNLDRSASSVGGGSRRVAAALLHASSAAGAAASANIANAVQAADTQLVQEPQALQQPAPQPPLPESYLQSGQRHYGRSLSAQAALGGSLGSAPAPALPPAVPAAPASPAGVYGSSPAPAASSGLPYACNTNGGAAAVGALATTEPLLAAAAGPRLSAQSPSLLPPQELYGSARGVRGGAGLGQPDALELQLQLRSMERQQASMRRTVEQQQEVLRDKDELLKALQGQLQTAKAQVASAASPRTGMATEQIAAERTALANERSTLVARLAEAEAALQTSREEAAALRRLQLELQSRHPEVTRAVEAAVSKEQAQQEDRNRKALEMLMGKDKRITELEAQVEELQRGSEKLRGQAAELQARAQAAEDQVIVVLRQKEALMETSQRDRQQAEHMIADLEARLADGNDLAVELLATQEALATAERRAVAAEQQLAAAEHRVMHAEAMAAGVEAMQRRLLDQRDGHVDTALAMAEELRARSVALQEHHAEAMRLQADAHRRQVAELESRIVELAAELQTATEQGDAGELGGAGPRPRTAESTGTSRQPASRQQPPRQPPAGAPAAGEDDELDVSLGAGMAVDPRDLVSAITSGGGRPTQGAAQGDAGRAAVCLQQPPAELQAANARLQAEVEALRRQLVSAAASHKDRAWDQAELERLRSLVAERDIEVADLGSQLQVLKARLAVSGAGTAASGQASSGPGRLVRSPGASPGPAYRSRGTAAFLSPSRERAAAGGAGTGSGKAQSAERERGAAAGAFGGCSSEESAVIETLRRQLAKSEAALRGARERLSMMEARAAVAQESAGQGEQRLEAVHRSMVGSALEHERLQQELEAARTTAVKLNGRISDLVLAEQVARAEVEAAKSKLGQLQELHTSEVSELSQQLERLTDHVAAMQPEVLPVLLGPAYAARANGRTGAEAAAQQAGGAEDGAVAPSAVSTNRLLGGDAALTREAELEKAVEAAETAVAVMQSRLLAALKEAADAAEEAARARRDAERERDRLEAEVRAAREEGSLRIRTLEESVARLGARGGEASQALARAAAEADAAVRRESRLRSELALAQQATQRANTQTAEIRLRLKECEAALREAQVYGGLLPFLHDATAAGSGAAGAAGKRTDPGAGDAAGAPALRAPASGGASAGAGAGGGGAAVSYHVLDEQLEVKLRQQAAEIARKQQVIARLVDVAEQAQGEATAVKIELDRLKQAAPDPKQPLQQQFAEVQRRLGATDAELRACKDAKASCELEVARLQQQLAERVRELDLAAERLAGCEREVADKEDAAARKAIEIQGAMSKEAAMLGRRVAEAQRSVDDAEARARDAEAQLVNLKAELAEARAELASQGAELRKAKLKVKDERRTAEEALRQAKRTAELATAEAAERRAQLSVLMETVEVLQAGSQGEREQRIVSLTAQLTAAANRESVAEQRAQALLADADACSSAVQQLQGEVADLEQQAARLEQQLAAAASSRLTLEGELAAARSEVRSRDAEALRAARELDDRQARLDRAEGELEAVRRALNDCQARHVEQLAREREEAAAAVRQARAESSGVAVGHAQAARLDRFQASLDEVVAWIESRLPPPAAEDAGEAAGAPAVEAPASSWVVATLQRLKALALESERAFLGAATDARVYRLESRWAWGRAQRLQAALEQRTGEWQVAQARVQMLERCVSRRSEEAAMHALQVVALQDRQLGALQERLTGTMGKLVVSTSQAASAEAAMAAARATIAALQRQVTVGGAERKELAARLAAADMESAGCAEALQLGAEAAQAQRDLALRQYWDAQVASLLARPEAKDKVMALAREVCALKLSESQLQSALAAARHRGDAASKLAASLAASLRGAEETVEQLSQQQLASVPSSATGAEGASQPLSALAAGGGAASGLGLEVARLSAQLVAQTHEMFRLQESELRAKQAYERRESDLQELQAQVAAAELLLSQVRAEGSAALLALREQLSEAHEQDRELLMRELRELQARLVATHDLATKDVEAAERRIAEAAQAADAAVDQRVSAALQGQVDAAQLQEAAARAARAEREATHLAAQVEAMQEALTQAQAHVGELEDVRDVTGAAVASLEATLARIEKAAADAAAAPGRGRQLGSAGGARRVPVGGAATPGGDGQPQQPQAFAALSRELVRAKLTEAEALRKMRAVARNEVELRQKLMQRDERIAELKEQLAAKGQAYEEMRRRSALMAEPAGARLAGAGAGLAAAAGGAGGGARGLAFRSRSPSPIRGVGAGATSSRPSTAAGRRASAEHAPLSVDAAAVAAGTAADVEHLAAQVSQLRLELARRQAEIDRLQGALAEAHAAVAMPVTEAPAPARPPTAPPPARPSSSHSNAASVERLKDQLASANAELAAALSSANGLLRRLGSAPLTTSSAPKRGASPARSQAAAGGVDDGSSSSDLQLSPGTLSTAMDRLTQAVQAALTSTAAGSFGGQQQRVGPVSPTRGSRAAHAEELARAQQDRAVAERQRDELSSRCNRLERELESCRARGSALQAASRAAAAPSAAAGPAMVQSQGAAAAAAASAALEGSVAALQATCDRVQRAASSAAGPVDAATVQQAMRGLSTELRDMESALSQLRAAVDGAPPVAPTTAHATGASTATEQPPAGATASGVGSRRRIEPLPTSLFASLAAAAAGGSGAGTQTAADPNDGGQCSADTSATPARPTPAAPEHTPATASSWTTATPGTALHTGLDAPQTLAPVPGAVDTAAMHAALSAAQSQAAAMSTAAAQQKARADKWKQRSKELGAQLSLLNASAFAREAAASERNLAVGQQAEQELAWCRAEIAKLQAALSGVEAARKELEASQGAGGGGELRAALARAAEAAARASTLQRQLETERAQAAAAAASQREEVAVLKAVVAQEKGERARLLVSLRESHTNAQQAGDSEAKLRNEALEAHSAAAVARATAERTEERAAAWREEASTLRQQLQQAERARTQLLSGLEMRLAAAERRATESAAVAAARIEELVAKLATAQAEAAAAPVVFESRLRDMEARLFEMQAQSTAAQHAAASSVQASRWGALTRAVRYQAAIKSLQGELTGRQAEWERERAGLQGAAEGAVRRAEVLLAELTDLRQQVSELKAATDADRQELTARHVAHVQELQQRIEQERRAMSEEADARAEAAAAATAAAAQQAEGVRLGTLEAEYRGRLGALEAERTGLSRELELVHAQFSQYQSQKAAEVAALEQRVRAYIDSGAAPAAGGSRRVAKRAHSADTRADEDAPGGGYGGSASSRPAFGGGGGYRSAAGRGLRRPRASGSRAAGRNGRRAAGGAGCSAAAGVAAAVLVPTMLQQVMLQPIGGGPAGPGAGPTSAGAQAQQAAQLAPSQVVALARGSEALAAAQREVAFERSLRCRAEAQAGLLRGAMARLRAKLRAATEELAAARADAISPDEHRQLQTDLSLCREQLKSCRAESARRQKALTVLQGLVSHEGATVTAVGASAAGIGAAAPTASSAARVRAAAGAMAASSAAPAPLPPRVAPVANLGVSFPLPPGFDSFNGTSAGFGGGGLGAGDSDPLPAALEAAAAGARATAVALEAERGARAALEARLRETKAALDRKTVLHKEAKRRVEELEAAAAQRATAVVADSGAEARAKALAATLARKEALVRELREKLEAAAVAAERGDAAAAAGSEELEAARKVGSRLKADMAKREAALRAATAELEKERKMLAAATKQLDEGSRREAAARRAAATAATALRRRAGELLEGLRGLARVLLQAVAAMDVAADRLRQHRPAPGPAVAAVGGSSGSSSSSSGVSAGGERMSAMDISQLTSLSLDDVRHLLGPEALPPGFGLAGSADIDAERALLAQPFPLSNGNGVSGAAVTASLEAAQRVGDLLAVLEVALATAADAAALPASPASGAAAATSAAPGYAADEELMRDQVLVAVANTAASPEAAAAAAAVLRGRGGAVVAGGGGSRAGARAGHESELWDAGTLQALVAKAQEEAQRAEGALAVALRRAGAL